jgi:hypothetical protein
MQENESIIALNAFPVKSFQGSIHSGYISRINTDDTLRHPSHYLGAHSPTAFRYDGQFLTPPLNGWGVNFDPLLFRNRDTVRVIYYALWFDCLLSYIRAKKTCADGQP